MDWRERSIKMALRLGPALLILAAFVSMLLGIIFHAITIDDLQFRNPPATGYEPDVIIGPKLENLVWFIQVSDLHISINGPDSREKDFDEFVKKYLDIVKPDVVLVTGDITDARKPHSLLNSGQIVQEWLKYSNVISKNDVTNKTVWLDVRGNHDNFGVLNPQDPLAPYRQYSVQGKLHSRNYMHILEKDGKKYSFIGVDEVQTPGLKMPFDFLGVVKNEDIEELVKFKQQSRDAGSQYNIWFGHYPTSSIASHRDNLKKIVDGPYLCGHYHTIGNWVTKMHATQQPGYAEVELGDWKGNRNLRLAAIDHQLFSLVDVKFKQFPIALMTNPKTAEHAMPKYEPLERISSSTHLRVIAFSDAPITNVEVSLDDRVPPVKLHLTSGPLYTGPWNPGEFKTGIHKARISVTDARGKVQVYNQEFSLDGSSTEPGFLTRALLRVYFTNTTMSIALFMVTLAILPLLSLRFIARNNPDGDLYVHYRQTFLYKLHLLAHINRLFWPLIFTATWRLIGPLCIGHLLEHHIGAVFIWGAIVDGVFVYTGLTYNFVSLNMTFVHIPMVFMIASQVGASYRNLRKTGVPASIGKLKLLIYLMITMFQMLFGSLLMSAYGFLAFLTSSECLWAFFIYAYCWYQCTTLEKSDFTQFVDCQRPEEQKALTNSRARDDRSTASDHSIC